MVIMSIVLYGIMMALQFFLYPRYQRKTAFTNMILQVPAIVLSGIHVDVSVYLTRDGRLHQ